MTHPPRIVESMLEALGAESRIRDGVLGDLAEEFASRVERDGIGAARRWYRREAVRAAPHLLYSGWRGVRRRGLGRTFGIMFTAFTGTLIVEQVIFGMLFGVLRAAGIWHTPLRLAAVNPVWQLSMVALGTMCATLTGYVAAWLDRDAQLFTALFLGAVWSLLEAAGLAIAGGSLPEWYRLVVPLAILCGTAGGAVLRVNQVTGARPGSITIL
jgi:hypothetical protein